MKELIGRTLGQYEVQEVIGQGGMATVYKAYQPALDRYVAIKVLSPTFAAKDSQFVKYFQREVRAIATLHHPHVLQVYDYGLQGDYSYLVMRYIESGVTLADLIRDGAPQDQLIDYITQIADALSYVHKRGVIHRDIKPSNILIDGKWAMLSDFGLAKLAEGASQLTGTGIGIGTPAYMSPEQSRGVHVDHRTDIYALGIILYRILTGTVPHDAPTPLATLVKRSTEPAPSLREFNPDISESLAQVTQRAIATNPADRYNSAADFGRALRTASVDPHYREVTAAATMKEATVLSSASGTVPTKPQNRPALLVGGAGAAAVLIAILLLSFFIFSSGNTLPTPMPQTSSIVINGDKLPTNTPLPTPSSTPNRPGTPQAVAKTDLAVWAGPGDQYDLIGYLPAGASAAIISRDETGEWWQIRTNLSTAGVGWIEAGADSVETTNTNGLPIALAPSTPTSTQQPVTPTPTPTRPPDTSTPTSTPTRPTATATSGNFDDVTPTATVTPPQPTATIARPAGEFRLLAPTSLDEPTFGPTEFEWWWSAPLAEDQGFEVRVWREGDPPAGVHNAVLDNRDGTIQTLGDNRYRLVVDISEAFGVKGRSGDYNWTVVLVQIAPEYRDLGIQAPVGQLSYVATGGGGSDAGGGSSGGVNP